MTPVVPDLSLPLRVILYCAEEVDRQQDEQLAVGWLCTAWAEAVRRRAADPVLTVDTVEALGKLVSPPMNASGFRQGMVRVGSHLCPPPTEVRPALVKLLSPETLATRSPDKVYYEFQLIHPFNDGNGRTGKVVLNWLNNSLDAPIMPSNWFHCANP